MSRRTVVVCVLAATLGGSVGCGSARFVQADSGGGVVAIPHNTNCWPTYYRDKADALLRQRFPGGYDIEREEEVVTGTVAHTNSQTKTDEKPTLLLAGANGTSEKTSRDGTRFSDVLGGLAVPLGQTEQKTEQTTTYRNLTEYHIHVRAR
jgi:hypothetical protein